MEELDAGSRSQGWGLASWVPKEFKVKRCREW